MQLLSSIADLKDIVNKEYIDSILADYVLSANLGALATKDSLAFSDLTSRPSKLSDFTDDVVAGKYLPLSGGTVTGTIEFTASTPALKFYRDYGNVPYIHFGASPTSGYGEVGADKNGNLVFWSLVSGNSAYNAWNTVLHAKNIGEYALKKVANVTSLNTNAGEFFYSGFRPEHIPYGNYVGGITLQTFRDAENDYRTQLAFSTDAKGFVRSYVNGSWSYWKTIAFTDSDITGNAGSATKLADNTAFTAWGQTFFENGKPKSLAGTMYFGQNQAALAVPLASGESAKIFLQVNPDGNLLIGQQTSQNSKDTRIYGNTIGFCYGTAGSTSATAMTINASGNVTIGSSDTAGADYKLRVDGESRFTDRVSVASLRIVPVNGSYAADFTIEGSSLTLNRELKFTNVTASDICSGIAAAFKTSLAQAESLIARNIILGASSGSASNLALNFQKYTSISNTAPNGLTTLMTLTTDGNLGIGTTNPAYKLDVAGSIGCTGGFAAPYFHKSDEFYIGSGALGVSASGALIYTYNNLPIYFFTSGSTAMTIDSGHGVTMEAGFHVKGNTVVGGALTVGAGATFNGDARINGNLVVTGDTASGNSTLTIGTIVLTDENGTLKIAGNAYTTGQLGAGEAGQPTSGGGSVHWSNEYDMDIGADILVSSKEYIGTNTIVGWDLAGSCLNDLYIGYDGYTIWMQGSVDEASDMRLKTVIDAVNLDIRDIAFAPIFNYVFKSRPQGRQMLGSSAQYWQAITPKAVSENDKGNLAMNYGAIALASVVAVAKKVVTHEEEIAELKSKVQSLETRLAKYELN